MKLSALKVRSLTKPGTYGDGAGLYLQVRGASNRSWLYRFKLNGKPHLMGLGALADVSLAEARDAAATARKLVRQGVDPIAQRRSERADTAAKSRLNTFAEVAEAYVAAHETGWRNARHRQQWRNTLDSYVRPVIGDLGIAAIDTGAIMRVLEPIWRTKPETASRLRGRIESVLDYATARGWRTGENPARWRGHIENLLPPRSKMVRIKHHAALPWSEIGAFMARLREQKGASALALQYVVLTAARTGEILGARWSEIDLGDAMWTVPGNRMKAGREHRVPLSDVAMDVLRDVRALQPQSSPDEFVFPGRRPGIPLSKNVVPNVLRTLGRPDLTVHGFRSTFRDWCAEMTNYPNEVAEAALAHTIRDKAEAAYRRGDMMEKRRRLMNDWAAFCGGIVHSGAAEANRVMA